MTEEDRKELLLMMDAMRIRLSKDCEDSGWRVGVKAVAGVANNMLDDCMYIVQHYHEK